MVLLQVVPLLVVLLQVVPLLVAQVKLVLRQEVLELDQQELDWVQVLVLAEEKVEVLEPGWDQRRAIE